MKYKEAVPASEVKELKRAQPSDHVLLPFARVTLCRSQRFSIQTMTKISKALITLAVCALFFNPLSSALAQTRRRGVRHDSQRRAAIRPDPAKELREKTFNRVWEIVNEENFDPTFGGVDWLAVYSRYAPRVAGLTADRQLYVLLQQMLDEIPQSHFAIIPPDQIPAIKSRKRATVKPDGQETETEEESPEGEEEEDVESDNAVATQMLNGVGIDIRILDGQVVLTRVDADSLAAKAGLRVGFVLKSIDNIPLQRIPAGVDLTPVLQMRLRNRILVGYLGGEPGTDINLSYLDEDDKEHHVTLKREHLKGTLSQFFGNLPPIYTEFEARRLEDKIGYIRFTAFTPQLAEKLCGAIKSMGDAPGLVIDLRGNPGGVMGVASGVIGLLTKKSGLIGTLRLRTGSISLPTFPQRAAYGGLIVILVDRLSASTSEVMAATLQESGRAIVVGERSSGQVLGANIIKLPTGALFEYARAGFKTARGSTLEGKGVSPDIEKKLERSQLLKGEDSQLAEAVRQIGLRRENAEKSAPNISSKKDSNVSSTRTETPPPPQAPVVVAATSGPGNSEAEKGKDTLARAAAFKSTPQADQIMERYISAIGGREALERLKSRTSTGTCLYPFQNLSGKVTIYEEAPDRSSMQMEIPNLGLTKSVFDGTRGWMQNSLMGFYEYKGPMLALLRREFNFYKTTKYRELYTEMIYKGSFDSSEGKIDVLELVAADGTRDELHFDSKTGLLIYGGGAKLGDYRQVGEVKIPFLRTLVAEGMELKIQLEQVAHNVPVGPDAFAEPHSCFTGQ